MDLPLKILITLFTLAFCALSGNAVWGAEAPSAVELLFSRRAGQELRLYGRDLFRPGADSAILPPMGAIADDYRLGPGDELVLHLRGQVSRSSRHLIGQDGLLTVEDLRPLQATGRTLGDLRREVEEAVSAAHLQTQAYLSIGRTRQVGVLVLGEVARPGRQQLNAFATPLDALLAAGGIGPQGSLRAIRLLRPGEEPLVLDLYALLEQGDGPATQVLGDGARLVVPPLGPTIAVAGAVKRPGIYELPADDIIDGEMALALAGGPLRPGGDRTVLLRYDREGVEAARPLPAPDMVGMQDGDLLLHTPDGGTRAGSLSLSGHVETPGARPFAARLVDLIDRNDLPPDLYQPLAVLLRRNRAGGAAEMRAVDLGEMLAGRSDIPSQDGDELVLLGADDIAFLRSRAVLSEFTKATPAQEGDCPGLRSLSAALTADPAGPLAAGPLALAAREMVGPDLPCPPLFQDQPDLLPFLLSQSAFLRQGALRPGPYPILPGAKLSLIAPLAGAAAMDDHRLQPGEVVDIGGDGVSLSGAVRQPGLRPLTTAGTLVSLLGDGALLRDDAYGLVAILDRFDSANIARQKLLFAPAEVVAGHFDLRLRDGDRLTILSRDQVRLAFPSVERDIIPNTERTPVAQRAAQAVAPIPLSAEIRALLAERIISVRGAVAMPGDYPVAGPLPLAALLRAAGGLRDEADPNRVELVPAAGTDAPTSLLAGGVGAERPIRPGEALRVALHRRPTELRSVMVAGEVMEPGGFDLAPGEKLSSLLARAGGLTPQAYPAGAIFTRDSARVAEEEGLRRAAREMDRELAQMLGGKNPPDPQRVALARQLAEELRSTSGLGRITVQIDPEILASRPELDISLQAGDRLYIPKRPATVTVAGEVLAPASLLFDPQKQAEDYLRDAGGLTRFADDDRIFLIHPDGSAEPLDQPRGRHGRVAVTPGAMLVVPRDAEPLEILPLAQSITTILSQIAFGAAAIASISD
ncbi:sugar transporter [Niveispirillum sp. SYP-B3756]|uniref:SLBB domain-containing protein n=1 Tax=Niveispirillum sp. SYP-B3756 TaxID=2662178 RepID=UPI0012927D86|nr:sugar transporter [Niveispirillum sp. SYP-B3756]